MQNEPNPKNEHFQSVPAICDAALEALAKRA